MNKFIGENELNLTYYTDNEINTNNIGMFNLYNRLNHTGGKYQQDRMIKDKKNSMQKALMYSYQGAFVQKLGDENPVRALINPNKVKQDYDDKIISIEFKYNYTPGTIFEWIDTGSYWLIYLQDLEERAYFKGDIRKCEHKIAWRGANGQLYEVYAAVRGPVETRIEYLQKNDNSIDRPNHSLNILMPKTPEVLEYFKRYSKFYLKGLIDGDYSVCWRVEATDSISMPGVFELNAVEYYSNESEDDIANGITGGLIVEPVDPNPVDNEIKGETFIKPKMDYIYKCANAGEWSIEGQVPVRLEAAGVQATLQWLSVYSGQFKLRCGEFEKTIVVESLF